MLEECTPSKHLSIFTYADFKNKDEWDPQLDRLIKQIKKDFDLLKPEKIEYPPLDSKYVDTSRLPQTGFELFGRQKELTLLNEAWESDKVNVVSFVAYGGVGEGNKPTNDWEQCPEDGRAD